MQFLKNRSYRMQIFILSVLLIVVPSILLGIFAMNRTLQEVNDRYQESLLDLTTQINLNVNKMIGNAEKLSTIHIVNDEVREILTTDFSKSISNYSPSDQTMKAQIMQANLLNTDVIVSMFINQYGYVFDYNFNTYSDFRDIFNNIEEWAELARQDSSATYVAPIQHPKIQNVAYQNILPIIKILKDPNDFSEIGVFAVGINFSSVTDILSSSKLPTSTIIFFDQNDNPFFSTDEIFLSDSSYQPFLNQLQTLSQQVNEEQESLFQHMSINGSDFFVNTLYNESTGWKIVHVLDNSIITEAYRMNTKSFILVFLAVLLLALLLAYYISNQMSKSIKSLCQQIDQCEDGAIHLVDLQRQPFSNKEFHQIVDSYNRLNKRLTDSLKENYTIQINEKQMRLRMLQAQINPHFLYNTLNLISSIANIRGVPEIRTISSAISDLLRYNLKSGPIVQLKEEVEQIGRYITIQQIRFPNKFIYECALPKELEHVTVPVSILQPLVENTIVHGLDEKESGYIMINIYAEFQHIHILIADNGVGIEPEKLHHIQESLKSNPIAEIQSSQGSSSIGLLNVHQRIQAFCGKEYGISIDSSVDKGTIVDITLPFTDQLKPLQ